METAKLIVEYFKVLMWPLVVIVALLAFSTDLRKFLGRVQTISAGPVSVGTAPGTRENAQAKPAPDIWFNTLQSPISQQDCIQQARAALGTTGFKDGDIGVISYGYDQGFVGAIWCGARDNSVLITVAGPHQELQNRHKELQDAFLAAATK